MVMQEAYYGNDATYSNSDKNKQPKTQFVYGMYGTFYSQRYDNVYPYPLTHIYQ